MSIPQDDFLFYKQFLYEKFGYVLGDDKTYLLLSRLTPVSRKWDFPSLDDMTKKVRSGTGDQKMVKEIIDAMTTNETLFFRDERPFKYFREVLVPHIEKARETRKRIRIWSAACSTGQEPYSVAITLMEVLKDFKSWNIEIIATDLSDKALGQAIKGEYSQFEIQRGMPIQQLMKYFKQEGQVWRINDEVRNLVRFESFNLLEPMDKFGVFDIIFCRNVLIYFDDETKKKIFQKLTKRMEPDGYLYLGGAESVLGLSTELKIIKECPSLYTLQEAAESSAPVSLTSGQKGL